MALNPTGSTATAPGLPTDTRNPPVGGGNYNFGNTQNPNPPPSSSTWNPYNFYPTVGSVSMNPVPVSGAPAVGTSGTTGPGVGSVTTTEGPSMTSPNPFGLNTDQANTTLKELRASYGDGVGTAIFQYLMSSGGYNSPLAQQEVQATNAAMQKNIQLGEGNLQTNLAQSGISPNSSSSALEISNYLTDAYTKMNEIDASIYYDMWNTSQNRELQALEGAGQMSATHLANSPGVFDYLSRAIGLTSAGAGTASAVTSAIDPNADTGVLDALAGMAAFA